MNKRLLFQEECDTHGCNYDSLECSYDMKLYQNCSAIRQGIRCYDLFENGVCDKACNSEECLFDGWDCRDQLPECNPVYDSYCSHHFANAHCDRGCNTAECGWDGLDCDSNDVEKLADGTLVIVVLMQPEQFRKVAPLFLRHLALLLHSVPKIKHSDSGDEMIYPWPSEGEEPRPSRKGGSDYIFVQRMNGTRWKRALDPQLTG